MSSHETAYQPSALEVISCEIDGCWCKGQGTTLHNSATALLNGSPMERETTTPRNFVDAAKKQLDHKTLCDRGRYMVQSVLVQWLYTYASHIYDVEEAYNAFGGEGAVGLSFQTLKQKAQQGNGVVTPAGTASSYTSRANGPSEEAPSG